LKLAAKRTSLDCPLVGRQQVLESGGALELGAAELPAPLQQATWVSISALVMLAGIFVHIYLSTFGEPGTIQAMTWGTVSEPWAWTHHPAWYQEVTGRDPLKDMEAGAHFGKVCIRA
jgi:hypothetical protein